MVKTMIGFIEITQREMLQKHHKGLSENQINDICEKLSNNYDVFLGCDNSMNVILVEYLKNELTVGQLCCGSLDELQLFFLERKIK